MHKYISNYYASYQVLGKEFFESSKQNAQQGYPPSTLFAQFIKFIF